MIPRAAENTLRQLADGYPVLAFTGPRQSGKTTLARAIFDTHPYVTLENPAQREFAQSDPQGFLNRYADGAVIDEAQRCPDLFAWLQGVVDQRQRPAHFILTGSQQFGLLIEQGGRLQPIEIKSGATVSKDAFRGLQKWQAIAGRKEPRPILVYGGGEAQRRSDVDVVPWTQLGAFQQK